MLHIAAVELFADLPVHCMLKHVLLPRAPPGIEYGDYQLAALCQAFLDQIVEVFQLIHATYSEMFAVHNLYMPYSDPIDTLCRPYEYPIDNL